MVTHEMGFVGYIHFMDSWMVTHEMGFVGYIHFMDSWFAFVYWDLGAAFKLKYQRLGTPVF